MVHRVLIRVSFAAVLAAFILGGVPARALEKTILKLGWVPNGESLGYYVAIDQGYFKARGIDLKIVRGYGAGDTAKQVASGAVPFGDGDTSALIVARSKGGKSRIVAMKYQKAALAYFALADSGIKTPKDLVGRKIGEPPGGAMRVLFPALAEANGFDKDKVKFIHMSPAATIPSLLAGKVDAIGLYTSTAPILILRAKKLGKTVHGIVWADHGLKLFGNSLQVLDKLIAEKPALVRGVIGSIMKGYQWNLKNPEKATDIFLKFLPTSNRTIILSQFRIFRTHMITPIVREKGLGYVAKKDMEKSRDLITNLFKLKTRVPVEDLYTNEFLPGIKP